MQFTLSCLTLPLEHTFFDGFGETSVCFYEQNPFLHFSVAPPSALPDGGRYLMTGGGVAPRATRTYANISMVPTVFHCAQFCTQAGYLLYFRVKFVCIIMHVFTRCMYFNIILIFKKKTRAYCKHFV
jgi:hypothetical protein